MKRCLQKSICDSPLQFENGRKKRVIFPLFAWIVQKSEGKYRDHLIFKKFCSVFYRSALAGLGLIIVKKKRASKMKKRHLIK